MTKKNWLTLLIIIFVLSLIPLYLVGLYDQPSADDYFYATETAKVWSETHSLTAVLGRALTLTGETYVARQGNFTALFLMFMTPALFSESFYAVTPLILITSFVASMLFFFITVLRYWLGAGQRQSLAVALCVTFTALQLTLVPSDSFYWYNGAIYYTFFFALMLVLFALVTLLLKHPSHSIRVLSLVLSCLLCAVIGGGNFATSLFTVLILAVLIVFYSVFHSERYEAKLHGANALVSLPSLTEIRRRRLGLILILILGLITFFITVFAPGNAVRQAGVGEHSGLLKTFAFSFAYGAYAIAQSTSVPVLVLWILLIPLFYRMAKDSSYQFRYPGLVLLFTYGLFCAQGTPVFYAQGLRIPYRMMNIIGFAYYPFMAFNLIYLMGWIARRTEDKPGILLSKIAHCYDRALPRNILLVSGIALYAVGCLGRIGVTESETTTGQAVFSGMPASVSAVYSLVSGDAAEYEGQILTRDALLREAAAAAAEDPSVGLVCESDNGIAEWDIEVTVPALTVTPDPIFHSDITEDPTHWKNTHLEMFYGIRSIRTGEAD